jgi:hypothetical protein
LLIVLPSRRTGLRLSLATMQDVKSPANPAFQIHRTTIAGKAQDLVD